MIRTQIQLPDELYKRAKRLGAERELSLAEMTRRGLELFISRYPEADAASSEWSLPKVNGGQVRVSLADLHSIGSEEESGRSLGNS
ncbi:MAG: hypothetical protein ACI9VS_002783 [Candidatus Binatia bacterium]|jgi:hypothetical protein